MILSKTFGEYIRELREDQKLPLRKVAAFLDIDPSTLSKIERGERSANREYIKLLADLFSVSEQELLIIYLSDKIAYQLLGEEFSESILKVAEEKIRYIRSKNTHQSELKFG